MKELREKCSVLKLLRWLLELLAMTALYFILHTGGIKKYVILLGAGLVLGFLGRKKLRSLEAILCVTLPVITYVLVGGLSTLWNANPQMTSVRDLIFWIVPAVFCSSLYIFWGNDMARLVDFQFIGSCIAYVYHYRYWLLWYGTAEDTFAFVFGAFAVYYIYKKRWIFVPVAVTLMYFADKKIAFLATAAAAAVLFLLWIFKKSKHLAMTLWSLGITGIFYYVYLIRSGVLKHLCYSMGIIGNGRMTMYDRFRELYDFSPFFFGKGLGNISNILNCWSINTYDHLHNDLLKFYIELGFLGLLVFLASYGVSFYLAEKKFGKDGMCGLLAMAVYSMILFMTDNVSVYILYLVPLYSISFAMILPKSREPSCRKEETMIK